MAIDEKAGEKTQEVITTGMDRREALRWLVGAICVLPAAAVGGYIVLRYLLPKVVFEERRFRLAKADEIPDEGLEARVKGTTFVVIKQGDQFRAFSTVCTHLGCKVNWQPDLPGFHCPCHQGYFDANGKVTAGPPPLPLPEYPIEIEGDDIYIRLMIS